MRKRRLTVAVVLVAALAALGTSVGWAATRGGSTPTWMSGHMAGVGMMGRQTGTAPAPVSSTAEAKKAAQVFADTLGLKADEVLQFRLNYYVKLVDAKGNGATEVLVDPKTGYVSLEYGPAMMWNTAYGMASGRYGVMTGAGSMMGSYGNSTGMMGGGMMGSGMSASTNGTGMMSGAGSGGMMDHAAAPASGKAVDMSEARTLAQAWLDANDAGLKVETGGDSFPGYFTFETLRGGRIEGMISVNTSTGAVLKHWWHGGFVAAA